MKKTHTQKGGAAKKKQTSKVEGGHWGGGGGACASSKGVKQLKRAAMKSPMRRSLAAFQDCTAKNHTFQPTQRKISALLHAKRAIKRSFHPSALHQRETLCRSSGIDPLSENKNLGRNCRCRSHEGRLAGVHLPYKIRMPKLAQKRKGGRGCRGQVLRDKTPTSRNLEKKEVVVHNADPLPERTCGGGTLEARDSWAGNVKKNVRGSQSKRGGGFGGGGGEGLALVLWRVVSKDRSAI